MTEEKKSTQDAQVTQKPVAEDKKNVEESPAQPQKVTQAPVSDIRYSGFWVRGAALIIDSMIVTMVMIIIGMPVMMILGFIGSFMGPVGVVINFLLSFVGLFIAWGYFVFMTHKYKATLGKMAVGAQVLGVDGNRLSLGNVTLRETIGKFISNILFGIGYIMAAFTKKKQGLHDFIANSVVVYKDSQKGPNVPIVVIVYVLFSILMFVFVVFISSMVIMLSLLIAGIMSNVDNSSTPLETMMNGGFEQVFEEIKNEVNDDGEYVEMNELEDMSGEDGWQIEIDDSQFME